MLHKLQFMNFTSLWVICYGLSFHLESFTSRGSRHLPFRSKEVIVHLRQRSTLILRWREKKHKNLSMLASLLWYTQANLNTKSQQAFNNACEKTFTRNRKSAISFLPLNCSLAAICFSFSRDCESDSFFLSYSDVPPICQGNYGRGQIVLRFFCSTECLSLLQFFL